MIKTILIPSLISCFILLTSCDQNQPQSAENNIPASSNLAVSAKSYPDKYQSYQKPGANVRFAHNYDGTSAIGERENLQLIFTEQYSSGQMTIRLKPDTSLTIEPATQNFVFSLDNAKSHPLELSISATSAGKHFLNINASVMDETGQISNRVFAIAFYVGDTGTRQSKIQTATSMDKVIILPSQETGE